jgi:uncharacterized protein (TIGR03790 family)
MRLAFLFGSAFTPFSESAKLRRMITWSRNLLLWGFVLFGPAALGGGSGLNVVVVVNQNSTNSVQLGNYYCEKRGVPPQNLLRVNWSGSVTDWTRTNLDTVLRAPLNAMLTSRQLSNQIDFIVLSMDLPYRVNENTGATTTSGYNSTTAALHYGFKPDGCSTCPANLPSCNLPPESASAYAGSEGIFRASPPISTTSNSWLVMMITASNLPQAKAIVDRGVLADYSFPTQRVYLAKSFDLIRSIRHETFDDAVFDTRLRGYPAVRSTNISSTAGLGALLGFQNGVQFFTMPTNTFVPGAMADDLTSYSGDLFSSPDHVRVLDFINAGATAGYGTVVEPCAYLEKFPSPRNYFYQSRGFSIAECYYQSVTNPYQGIMVGEPLAAPFALPGNGVWVGLPANALLAGTTNLSVQFTAPDPTRPVQQVDLFVDEVLAQTLTNVVPAAGNRLYVTLPGKTNMSYTVPAAANLSTVASGIATLLNNVANNMVTDVAAYPHGDRVELRSTDLNRAGSQTITAVSNHVGTAAAVTTFLHAAGGSFLDTIAYGRRKCQISGTLVAGDTLTLAVTKTNGAIVTVSVTNSASANVFAFVQSFLAAVNAAPGLQGSDGLMGEDLVFLGTLPGGADVVEFNLRARSLGIKAAQIQVTVTGSFAITPVGMVLLNENLPDLQPRNHLYVTAGVTNLNLTFPFNTTTNADGYHELTVAAYEGSHVRTQSRVTKLVRIQNNGWSATLTLLMGGTNTALEAVLQFRVTANTNNITSSELFSTGGLLAAATSVTNAVFSIHANQLGLGLHPFYAVVTRSGGTQYRTETYWLRIIGSEPPFQVSVLDSIPTLTWPATAGRDYEILSTTNLLNPFAVRDSVTPTNSFGLWAETNNAAGQRFYRVRVP